jgi:hypothetical protein
VIVSAKTTPPETTDPTTLNNMTNKINIDFELVFLKDDERVSALRIRIPSVNYLPHFF